MSIVYEDETYKAAANDVTIVMAAYNSCEYIDRSIDSVFAQTKKNWELIVSDDSSTDTTLEIAGRYGEVDSRVRLLRNFVNRGPAFARNIAIEAAGCRYIAFLDSDDLWKPEKLERQISFMQEHDLALSFSSYDRIDEAGNFIDIHYVDSPVTYRDLLKSCVIGCLTAVYDTEKLGKIYMPEEAGAEDFGLWLRILREIDQAVPLHESLAQYRVRAGSVSANKLTAAKYTWRIYRDVEKLGLLQSSYFFAHYAARGAFNTYVAPLLPRR